MAWLRDIQGMPVLSVAEGKELGKVDALLFDIEDRVIRWLQLGKAGFFGETRVISVDAVQAIGENAITVDSESSAVPIEDIAEAQELARDKRRIVGNRMLTDRGRLLGEIRNYEIDEETFEITQYEIGKGDLIGTRPQVVPADYVLTIGPDAVLVEAEIEDELLEKVEELQAPLPPAGEEEPVEDVGVEEAAEDDQENDWPSPSMTEEY